MGEVFSEIAKCIGKSFKRGDLTDKISKAFNSKNITFVFYMFSDEKIEAIGYKDNKDKNPVGSVFVEIEKIDENRYKVLGIYIDKNKTTIKKEKKFFKFLKKIWR